MTRLRRKSPLTVLSRLRGKHDVLSSQFDQGLGKVRQSMQTRAKNIGIVGMEALLFCCVYGCYVCSTSGKRSDQSFAGRTKRLATVLLPSYFVVYFSLRRRLNLTNRGRWRQKNQRGLELLQGLSNAYASARLLFTKSELPLECLSGSSSFAVTRTYASYYI